MKELQPELEKLEERIAPDLLLGIGGTIGIGVGVGVGTGSGDTNESCGCDP